MASFLILWIYMQIILYILGLAEHNSLTGSYLCALFVNDNLHSLKRQRKQASEYSKTLFYTNLGIL